MLIAIEFNGTSNQLEKNTKPNWHRAQQICSTYFFKLKWVEAIDYD